MDEADASFTPSAENGQPVQTPAKDASNADIDNNINTKEDDQTPRSNAESQSSLLVQQILRYLQTADNEVLLAFLGALALLTYLVLGRLGILVIGLALGFLLHDYWGGIPEYGDHYGERNILYSPRRKELGIEVASRLLDWTSQRKLAIEVDGDIEVARTDDVDIIVDTSRFRPATAAAISNLIDAILQDYVK